MAPSTLSTTGASIASSSRSATDASELGDMDSSNQSAAQVSIPAGLLAPDALDPFPDWKRWTLEEQIELMIEIGSCVATRMRQLNKYFITLRTSLKDLKAHNAYLHLWTLSWNQLQSKLSQSGLSEETALSLYAEKLVLLGNGMTLYSTVRHHKRIILRSTKKAKKLEQAMFPNPEDQFRTNPNHPAAYHPSVKRKNFLPDPFKPDRKQIDTDLGQWEHINRQLPAIAARIDFAIDKLIILHAPGERSMISGRELTIKDANNMDPREREFYCDSLKGVIGVAMAVCEFAKVEWEDVMDCRCPDCQKRHQEWQLHAKRSKPEAKLAPIEEKEGEEELEEGEIKE